MLSRGMFALYGFVNLVPRVFLRHTLITKPNEQRTRGRATNSLWGRDWPSYGFVFLGLDFHEALSQSANQQVL